MTGAVGRWSLRCAVLHCDRASPRFAPRVEIGVQSNSIGPGSAPRITHLSVHTCCLGGILVQSRCLRDSRGSNLDKMFPGLGFARFNEAVSRTELKVVGGRGLDGSQQGVGACMGWLVELVPTGVF